MSLHILIIEVTKEEVFSANITHNLNAMATAAGIYYHLLRPEEINVVFAHELIRPLKRGLKKMKADPEKYKAFNSENGWGMYENFVPWLEQYLKACQDNPKGKIRVSR